MNTGYKYNKLRGRIFEKYGGHAEFANAVGITRQWLAKKLKGEADFSQKEIIKGCELLGIEETEIADYFFTQ